jgi:WD40 repeat protein
VRLFDATTLQQRGLMLRLAGLLSYPATISPDLRLLATFDLRDVQTTLAVRVFDLQSGAPVAVLTDLDTITSTLDPTNANIRLIADLSFSADSRRLAAATVAGAGAIWDLPTQRATPLADGGGAVRWLRYDPSGERLATVNAQGVITFRNGSTGAPLTTMGGRRQTFKPRFHPTLPIMITDLTCNHIPDGKQFDSQVWNIDAGIDLGVGFNITCADWSRDGKYFYGFGPAGIEIWDVDPQRWVDAACRFAGRNLTEAEWRTYVSDTPPRATCPD